jgi:hypothetical protein
MAMTAGCEYLRQLGSGLSEIPPCSLHGDHEAARSPPRSAESPGEDASGIQEDARAAPEYTWAHRLQPLSVQCRFRLGVGPASGGNMWRTTDDISDSYRSMALISFSQAGLEKFAGPGHWNDPYMLEIGNGGMTAGQYRTQMSLWAMLAAPLIARSDLSKMDETTKSILINVEVIAVDQDKLGIQGSRFPPPQISVKPLSGGPRP